MDRLNIREVEYENLVRVKPIDYSINKIGLNPYIFCLVHLVDIALDIAFICVVDVPKPYTWAMIYFTVIPFLKIFVVVLHENGFDLKEMFYRMIGAYHIFGSAEIDDDSLGQNEIEQIKKDKLTAKINFLTFFALANIPQMYM